MSVGPPGGSLLTGVRHEDAEDGVRKLAVSGDADRELAGRIVDRFLDRAPVDHVHRKPPDDVALDPDRLHLDLVPPIGQGDDPRVRSLVVVAATPAHVLARIGGSHQDRGVLQGAVRHHLDRQATGRNLRRHGDDLFESRREILRIFGRKEEAVAGLRRALELGHVLAGDIEADDVEDEVGAPVGGANCGAGIAAAGLETVADQHHRGRPIGSARAAKACCRDFVIGVLPFGFNRRRSVW